MTIVINRRIAYTALVVCGLSVLALVGWARLSPGHTIVSADDLTALDPDNAGINIVVTQPWLCDTVLTFDVRRPGERDFNRLDVTRCLLQCAQALKGDSSVTRVYLANEGRRLYYIGGSDFRQLGKVYRRGDTWNNASLAIQLPTVTYTLNDSLAFAPHQGLLSAADEANDWNTMMSKLLKSDDPSLLTCLVRWAR